MGDYVDAAGLPTYYEEQGAGPPAVLLHGGLATVGSWRMQVPALAEHYRVYVPERRGHGRTPDVEGPLTYAAMTADTIAFLAALGIADARLIGWSDGAAVAALVAMARPDLVHKLVLIGQYLQLEGERSESRAMLDSMATNRETRDMFAAMHTGLSPDGPEHFPVFYDKIIRMWRVEPDIPLADLARIDAPTLILQGDDDTVRVEHSALLARTIPHTQLAVLPGTSHACPIEKPDLVNRLILDFLADSQTERLMPLSPR
jgi:pimeloyl-ACP methyl ester carboxylesterase